MGATKSTQHFIISYGPAGSGKGHIVDNEMFKILKCLYPGTNFHDKYTYMALIDDYVESDEEFRNESLNIVLNYIKTHNIPIDQADTIDKMEKLFTDDQLNDIAKEIDDLYSKVRNDNKHMDLKTGKMKSYNDINTEKMISHLEKNNNVVLETTGERSFRWLWNSPELLQNKDHVVVTLIYPWVEKNDIITSAKLRFFKTLMNIKNNNFKLTPELKPPRIPNLKDLDASIDVIQNNFARCLIEDVKYEHVDNVIFWNNSYLQKEPTSFILAPKLSPEEKYIEKCHCITNCDKLKKLLIKIAEENHIMSKELRDKLIIWLDKRCG